MRNRLRVLRAERDLSQEDLAQLAEVSRQTINAVETGRYDPSLPLAIRLARIFSMSVEQVFFMDGDKAEAGHNGSPA